MKCPECEKENAPIIIDEDGTLSKISGKTGLPGHAIGDFYFHCIHYEKPDFDCPICGEPPRVCLCGHVDIFHEGGEGECGPIDEDCEGLCKKFIDDGTPKRWGS